MTSEQISEFQKLEMAYLDSVRNEDGDMQIKIMEVIFFWLHKQVRAAQSEFLMMRYSDQGTELRGISEMQKQEFTFLQMAMIKAVGRDDRTAMVEIELKMREWFDVQITAGVNMIFRPEIKIIRNFEN
jgi:hypothetical protein